MCDSDEIHPEDFPQSMRATLTNHPLSEPPLHHPASEPLRSQAAIDQSPIDVEALRRAIRSSAALTPLSMEKSFDIPAHIDHARRIWLQTLIEELNGDLALIGLFWDRSSEKTLRGLIREYGLNGYLDAARSRARQ